MTRHFEQTLDLIRDEVPIKISGRTALALTTENLIFSSGQQVAIERRPDEPVRIGAAHFRRQRGEDMSQQVVLLIGAMLEDDGCVEEILRGGEGTGVQQLASSRATLRILATQASGIIAGNPGSIGLVAREKGGQFLVVGALFHILNHVGLRYGMLMYGDNERRCCGYEAETHYKSLLAGRLGAFRMVIWIARGG